MSPEIALSGRAAAAALAVPTLADSDIFSIVASELGGEVTAQFAAKAANAEDADALLLFCAQHYALDMTSNPVLSGLVQSVREQRRR